MINGMKIAAQNRNNQRRRAGIWGSSFAGEEHFPCFERALWGKCFFGFKRLQLNKVTPPGKSESLRYTTGELAVLLWAWQTVQTNTLFAFARFTTIYFISAAFILPETRVNALAEIEEPFGGAKSMIDQP